MPHKTIVCACEDVTLHEIDEAISHGITDVEEIKRYTGFGTGPCQGKSCLLTVVRLVGEHLSTNDTNIRQPEPFTARAPLCGVPLRLLMTKP